MILYYFMFRYANLENFLFCVFFEGLEFMLNVLYCPTYSAIVMLCFGYQCIKKQVTLKLATVFPLAKQKKFK